ncbi:MAG: zinc-binding dehydrogenase [Myxococcota bacterium]
MRAWNLEGPGDVDAFQLVERPLPAVRPGWVRIAVEAFGLNRSELHSRKGLSSADATWPRVLGLECVGRIDDGGDSELRAGERVVALMGGMGRSYDGGYATHALVPRTQVFRAPEALDAATLGAVPETYTTAALVCRGDLALAGHETVLVRGGTSALGMAAAEIAKDLGCTTIGTTRNPKKAALLRQRSRLDHVVLEGERFAERVVEAAGPVHAVVECVGSTASVESSAATLTGGGKIGGAGMLTETWDTDAPPVFPEGVSYGFSRSDLVAAPKDDAFLAHLLGKVAAGAWAPNVHRVFAMAELPEAHRVMANNEAVGKLVVLTA